MDRGCSLLIRSGEFISRTDKSTLLTHSLTYSKEQSPPWEARQKIPHILWNPKVHCRIHICPPPVPILSKLNPVHAPTSHLLKIHINIILLSSPLSPKSFSLKFPTETRNTPLLSHIRPTRPAHLILLDFITRKILGEYRSLSSSLCDKNILISNFKMDAVRIM